MDHSEVWELKTYNNNNNWRWQFSLLDNFPGIDTYCKIIPHGKKGGRVCVHAHTNGTNMWALYCFPSLLLLNSPLLIAQCSRELFGVCPRKDSLSPLLLVILHCFSSETVSDRRACPSPRTNLPKPFFWPACQGLSWNMKSLEQEKDLFHAVEFFFLVLNKVPYA